MFNQFDDWSLRKSFWLILKWFKLFSIGKIQEEKDELIDHRQDWRWKAEKWKFLKLMKQNPIAKSPMNEWSRNECLGRNILRGISVCVCER